MWPTHFGRSTIISPKGIPPWRPSRIVTKFVSPIIRISDTGQLGQQWALNRYIRSAYLYWEQVSLAGTPQGEALATDVGMNPDDLPEFGLIHYHSYRMYNGVARNDRACALIAAAGNKQNYWRSEAYGDAMLTLHPGDPRRCTKVGRDPTDLADAEQWIADNDVLDEFEALSDYDVYLVQMARDSQAMRKYLMLAKLRFG